jgi:hypothetical protein
VAPFGNPGGEDEFVQDFVVGKPGSQVFPQLLLPKCSPVKLISEFLGVFSRVSYWKRRD